MNSIMLLTAKPRTGKTTCIQKIIERLGRGRCDGFYTEEVRADGERTGFQCVSLRGERATLADVNSDSPIRVSRYGVELEAFEHLVIPILESSLEADRILIIDGIGPMELFSEQFKRVLHKVLTSGKSIIGTIYYDEHPEVDVYKEYPNVELIHVTEENRNRIPDELAEKIKTYKTP
ncbi:hypothetical protein IMZ31_22140 (plasmid) [Pontibacillus sp. ALD_SL1]|uniref:nucleoside-triphosphatase n=1 Tax=Pontibacillus sp. ALD_SL1 TaxID=2777185 RepID=UPI001A96D379|nr:nucleoside-triphosphatase [Pontibacillus sp. ALD_SL1]QST02155.1 hypothetical protein IMZ31_22140 [Pontibacillus sp. ALD_SL1]